MPLLSSITEPRDLDALSTAQLQELAEEVRAFLIENVSRTGGHLGPNLGVVELTIAQHRVFDSPADPGHWPLAALPTYREPVRSPDRAPP